MKRGKLTNELIGTWKLTKFANVNSNGSTVYWDGKLNGYLIYTLDGFVTAAINRSRERVGETEFKDSFYVAAASLTSVSTVEHRIIASSDHNRIGTIHVRKFHFDNNNLILSGKGLTGAVVLTWSRLEGGDGDRH
jgi:hypothetical protein